MRNTRVIAAALLLAVLFVPAAHASPYLHVERFDADTVGQLPPGWGTPAFGTVNLANTSVQPHPTAPSPSRVFQVGHSGEDYLLEVPFNIANANLNPPGHLAYQFDLNVDFLNGNDSDGFLFSVHSNASGITAGRVRLLRNGAQWRLLNPHNVANGTSVYTTANFNLDQWYTMRVEFHPTSSAAGQVRWYVGDSALDLLTDLSDDLVLTETYSGMSTSQTQGIKEFHIRAQLSGSPGARMYMDNLSVVTPEPAGLALLAIGAALALRRRKA